MKGRSTVIMTRSGTCALLLVFSTWQVSAAAESTADTSHPMAGVAVYSGPKLKRLAGQYLAVCDQQGQACIRVKMPKGLGKVEQVFAGPLIENVRASWVALSKFDSFVCAALENRSKVVCAKIPETPFPAQYANLRVKVAPSAKVRLAVLPKSSVVDPTHFQPFAKRFNAAFKRASAALQGEVDAATSPSYSFATTMSVCDSGDEPPPDPGPQPHPDCELVDNMWSCPVVGHPEPDDPVSTDPEPEPEPEPDPEPDVTC